MDSNSVSRLSEPGRDKIRQLFGNRNLWYLFGIACGAVATAYFSQLLFKQVKILILLSLVDFPHDP